MITIRCWRVSKEYLVLGFFVLLGALYLSHWYNTTAVIAEVEEDVEVALANQMTSGLQFDANLVKGYVSGVTGDSLTITETKGATRLPDDTVISGESAKKQALTLKIDGQTKLWKGGQASLSDLKPGDVVFAELSSEQAKAGLIKRAWINLGQYRGKVSRVEGDNVTLDASGEGGFFQKQGLEGNIKPVKVTGKTIFWDGNRQKLELKDIKLGDTVTAIGCWDKVGVLTATKVLKY